MRKIFVIIILGVSILSCHTSKKSSSGTVSEKNNASYLNGSWQLQSLFASDNKWTNAPVINIDLKNKSFSGNSGCNFINGKFTINASYLAFDKNIISTKMGCTSNYEKSFLAVLLKINRYNINKDALELGQGEIVLMRFKRS